jgi:hypothetical protein
LPCACFGALDSAQGRVPSFLRALVLVVAVGYVLAVHAATHWSVLYRMHAGRPTDLLLGAASGAALVVGLALVERIDDFNRRRIRAVRRRPLMASTD